MPKNPTMIEIPESCPFRRSSNYAVLWSILLIATQSEGGISQRELLKQYEAATGKPERLCMYDIRVITGTRKHNAGHPSAHGHKYWVDRQGGRFVLHLDDKRGD